MSSINIKIEGGEELAKQLLKSGVNVRKVVVGAVRTALRPTMETVRSATPVGPTGRLRASIGFVAAAGRNRDGATARIGVRHNFKYRNVSGEKMVSGRGKTRERAIKAGYAADDVAAQQYARLIETGEDSKGRRRRAAGGANFLDASINQDRESIISTVENELRRAVENI